VADTGSSPPNHRPKPAENASGDKPAIITYVKPEMEMYVAKEKYKSMGPGRGKRVERKCTCNTVCECEQVAACGCDTVHVRRPKAVETVCRCDTVPVCTCDTVASCTCDRVSHMQCTCESVCWCVGVCACDAQCKCLEHRPCPCTMVRDCACQPDCSCDRYHGGGGSRSVCVCVPVIH